MALVVLPIADTTINKLLSTSETIRTIFRIPSADFTDAPPNL